MSFFTTTQAKRTAQSFKESRNMVSKSEASILAESASEFNRTKYYDIFLSHSFLDASTILGIKVELERMGYSVYVDWIEDKQLDRTKVNKYTARVLQERMNQSKCLFFATSDNHSNSKWMPWELGFMDGKKDKAAILPVLDHDPGNDSYSGQEYLGVYPYIVKSTTQENTNKMTLFVSESSTNYVSFDAWLLGQKPTERN
ncbi:MAG: TIR domain-containing protein [Leptonema illini]|uniref:TIR domain-containing protein n=1 Tax=Leptonema illini TaxID=183 RepID=A0A833H0I2_9LEPT|nr:MAG: TIR domain-containing protein [Leptonema illini]